MPEKASLMLQGRQVSSGGSRIGGELAVVAQCIENQAKAVNIGPMIPLPEFGLGGAVPVDFGKITKGQLIAAKCVADKDSLRADAVMIDLAAVGCDQCGANVFGKLDDIFLGKDSAGIQNLAKIGQQLTADQQIAAVAGGVGPIEEAMLQIANQIGIFLRVLHFLNLVRGCLRGIGVTFVVACFLFIGKGGEIALLLHKTDDSQSAGDLTGRTVAEPKGGIFSVRRLTKGLLNLPFVEHTAILTDSGFNGHMDTFYIIMCITILWYMDRWFVNCS